MMAKRTTTFPLLALVCLAGVVGAVPSTIDPFGNGARYAYGANAGWINLAGDSASGVVIGEYVCSGYAWAANLGWIHFGDGSPSDGIRYANDSATDFGVNLENFACAGGSHTADLRGHAYGANIGWITFEEFGDPRINLGTGELGGYAWSANLGWITLKETGLVIETSLQPAPDSDGDGIGDPYEYHHTGGLTTLTATGDSDADGAPDPGEYAFDTDPLDPVARPRIVSVESGALPGDFDITFTTRPTRVYQMQANHGLLPGSWADTGVVVKPAGATVTTTVTDPGEDEVHFWRVRAEPPLQP